MILIILKVTKQIVDSKLQILTMTAHSEKHKPNNKCFLGIRHFITISHRATFKPYSKHQKGNVNQMLI